MIPILPHGRRVCIAALALALSLPLAAAETVNAAPEKPLATNPAPKEDSPWAKRYWYPAHENNLQETKKRQGARLDILLLGDSITHAFSGKAGRAALQENFPGATCYNLGVKGDTTSNLLWRIQEGEIEGLQPKLTILMIGTNNTSGDYKPAETAAGIKAVLEQLKTRLPHSKILLLGVFPRGQRSPKNFQTCNAAINAIIKDYGDDKQVFYLDISKAFLADNGDINPELYARDQLHINDQGYGVWCKAMKPTVDKLMGEQ